MAELYSKVPGRLTAREASARASVRNLLCAEPLPVIDAFVADESRRADERGPDVAKYSRMRAQWAAEMACEIVAEG